MTPATVQTLTLEEFLKLPETDPSLEYIKGEIIQKPMPKGRHSRLQGKLCAAVNQVTEEQKIAVKKYLTTKVAATRTKSLRVTLLRR